MTAPPSHHFDRGKPFYPFVMTYVCQLVGVRELAIRGIAGPRHLDEMVQSAIARDCTAGIPQSEPMFVREHLLKIYGPIQLRSEILDKNIDIPDDVIAEEFTTNFSYLMPHVITAAGILLVMAHEISKRKPWH